MATCATFGQAAGTAAALACRHGCLPLDVETTHIVELQQLLMIQDQFIPNVKRRFGKAAMAAIPSDTRLIDGVEREDSSGKEQHSILLRTGDSCGFTFNFPTAISGVRLVWDSNFKDDKRMRCVEGEDKLCEVPSSLAKSYLVEGNANGEWRVLARRDDNFRRLDIFSFPPIVVEALRLTLLEERKPGESARLFAFEPLD